MTSFRFTVVIPTYQRREVVLATVRALSSQEGAEPFEVVVVVDGSTDGTAAALRGLQPGFPLTVVEQANRGNAAARNRGAAAARGELLLFLDDDMEAHPGLLAEHARSHREGADVVFGHIPLHPESPPSFLAQAVGAWAEDRRLALLAHDGQLEVRDFLTGQMSLPREVFLELGGFDENFTRGGSFGGADLDFGRRLAQAGYRPAFNPDAISWQRYVVTPRRYLRQWRDNGRAWVMLARKHPDLAASLRSRRELLADRLPGRWIRRPLRRLVLALIDVGSIRPWTIRWFYRVQDLEFCAGVRAAGGVPQPRPVRVLCYHSISDLRGAGTLEPYGVPPGRFRRQLKLLASYFNFIDAEEFRRFLEGGGVPRRALLLTFDDGLRDLADAALPTLRELHLPAVAFAVTGLVGRTNEWSSQHERTPLALLDADGLRTLTHNDLAIGAHTRTHRPLSGLPTEEASEEINGSIADLEALSVGRPSFLAYPYGAYDAAAKRIAADAGLSGAFTTERGLARPGVDPYQIPRIEILRGDRGLRFLWKVAAPGGPPR